jgi:bacteriorhodopsin
MTTTKARRSGKSSPQAEPPAAEEHEGSSWVWMAVGIGAALGAIAVISLLRYRNPVSRMDRILRRCENRIHDLEAYLSDLESSLSVSPN